MIMLLMICDFIFDDDCNDDSYREGRNNGDDS